MQVAKLESCHDYEKLVVLLLDEMHVREDLVYDKHSGKLVGFVNMGEVSNLLEQYEHSLRGQQERVVAKSMMVRGLFSPVRYPYALFPCEKLTGSLLFHPYHKAVQR